jgi:hypothetical protein
MSLRRSAYVDSMPLIRTQSIGQPDVTTTRDREKEVAFSNDRSSTQSGSLTVRLKGVAPVEDLTQAARRPPRIAVLKKRAVVIIGGF